jgi:mitochondrial import receptor subunit TOM40
VSHFTACHIAASQPLSRADLSAMGATISRADSVIVAAPAADLDEVNVASDGGLKAGTAGLVAALAALDDDNSAPRVTDSNFSWWRNFPRSELPNPGAYEDMNQEATIILRPNTFEGMSFNMSMPVGSQSFSLGQSIEMGAKDSPGSYAFSANYFTNRLVMISRVTPVDGRVNGRIFYTHTPSLTSKIIADVGSEPDSSKASWDLDYRGTDFCSQLKLANGGIAAVSYLQSVTPTIAIGGEGFYQGKSRFSAITAAAKYSNGSDIASLTVASFGPIIASYMHRVNPKTAYATEMYIDGRTMDSHVSLGYRFDLTTSSVTGNIDSSGRVAAVLESRINPILTFNLTGEIDHARGESRFGWGVSLGGA